MLLSSTPLEDHTSYEHSFVHAVADFLEAIASKKPIHPNLDDGVKIMKVLEAGIESNESGSRVEL